jgi:hypothetical protein
MKKLLALTLALAALAMLHTASRAQSPENPPSPPSPNPHQRVLSLPCCKCLGEATTINLSTGQAAIDPYWQVKYWQVNAGPAYTTPPFAGWMSLPPARWIQPVARPRPSGNVPAGVYHYTLRFDVPRCTIPGTARLVGRLAADNTMTASLDGTPIPGAFCVTLFCFKSPDAPRPLNLNNIGPGSHLLEIVVMNRNNPLPLASGLIVNARLERQCRKE